MRRAPVPFCILAGLVFAFSVAHRSGGTEALLGKRIAFLAKLADAPPESLRPLDCKEHRDENLQPGDICFLATTSGKPRLLVWGDSHARIPFETLRDPLSTKYDLAFAAKGGCALVGTSPDKSCAPMQQRIWAWLQQQDRPVKVLFLFRWETALAGQPIHTDRQLTDLASLDIPAFHQMLKSLPPNITPVFVGQVPRLASRQNPHYSPGALEHAAARIVDTPEQKHFQMPSLDYMRLRKLVRLAFADQVFVAVHDLFCRSETECLIYDGKQMLYKDDDHINLAGAALLVSPILQALGE